MQGVSHKVWGIRAGEWNFGASSLFTREGYVGLGWKDSGDLSDVGANRSDFQARLQSMYGDDPKVTDRQIVVGAGALHRFVQDVHIGDTVVYDCKIEESIYIGRVQSDYIHDATKHADVHHLRKVEWLADRPRESFSDDALRKMNVRSQAFWPIDEASEFLVGLDQKHKR